MAKFGKKMTPGAGNGVAPFGMPKPPAMVSAAPKVNKVRAATKLAKPRGNKFARLSGMKI